MALAPILLTWIPAQSSYASDCPRALAAKHPIDDRTCAPLDVAFGCLAILLERGGNLAHGAAWAYDARVSEKVAVPVRAACRVVLPGGSDGVATVWIRRLLRTDVAELPLISVDPIVCGISI